MRFRAELLVYTYFKHTNQTKPTTPRYSSALLGPLALRKAACSLSHVREWHDLAVDRDDGAWRLILEDDASLNATAAAAVVADLFPLLTPWAWDIVMLELHAAEAGTWHAGTRAAPGLRLSHGVFGNTAYLLSRRGARKLLHCGLPLARWQDLVVRSLSSHYKLCFFTPDEPYAMSLGATNFDLGPGQRFKSSIIV